VASFVVTLTFGNSAIADKPRVALRDSVKVIKHGTIPYLTYGFLLPCYSNFVPVPEIFDFNNVVTLKTGLGSVKVIENVTIR